jgi:hypothetical protein
MVPRKILSTIFVVPFLGQCANVAGSGKAGMSFAGVPAARYEIASGFLELS